MVLRFLYEIIVDSFKVGDTFSEEELQQKLKEQNIVCSQKEIIFVLNDLVKNNTFKVIKNDNANIKEKENETIYEVVNKTERSEADELIINLSKLLNETLDKYSALVDSKNMSYYLDNKDLLDYVWGFADGLENFGYNKKFN